MWQTRDDDLLVTDTRDLNRRIQMAYDGIVETYAVRNAVMPPIYRELGTRFVALAQRGRPVLDAGCGVGRDLAWLEAQGWTAVGLDVSHGMLRHARGQGARAIVQADLRRLPFSSNQFGGVWCSASLLHLPRADAQPVLRELRRVAVRGAPMLLSLQEGTGEQWERGRYGSEERLFTRYRRQELEELVRESGFQTRELHDTADPKPRWLTLIAIATG